MGVDAEEAGVESIADTYSSHNFRCTEPSPTHLIAVAIGSKAGNTEENRLALK